jgi:type IV secretion system protein VirD4
MARQGPSPFKFGYEYDIEKDEADNNAPLLYQGELHILLFGLNGAGKSTRILVENLVTLQNRCLVVLDVKGELAAQTARTRRTLGDVKIINPYNEHGMGSDGYNPLTALDPDDDEFFDKAKQLALAIIEIEGDTGRYFSQSAAGWLCGGIMWEVVQAKREARVPSLLRAREWCLQPDQYGRGPDGKEVLVAGARLTAQRMVKEGGTEIANLAFRFAREEPLTRGDQDILQTLNTETEFLISRPIARDLEKGQWSFAQLRERLTTVYIVLPFNQLEDKRRWVRVIITAALVAHLKPSPLKTTFIFDEFKTAIGNLPIINQFWALMRGYGVQFMPVCQSILDLQSCFKVEWEKYAGQAGAVATIGPAGDLATAEWMSKRSGNTTVWTQGWNEGQGINPQRGGMPTSNLGESRSQTARPLLLP